MNEVIRDENKPAKIAGILVLVETLLIVFNCVKGWSSSPTSVKSIILGVGTILIFAFFSVALLKKNKKVLIIPVSLYSLMLFYYLLNGLQYISNEYIKEEILGDLYVLLAYIVLLISLFFSIKKNGIAKILWIIPSVILFFVFVWASANALIEITESINASTWEGKEYYFSNWTARLGDILEILSLFFIGLWIKKGEYEAKTMNSENLTAKFSFDGGAKDILDAFDDYVVIKHRGIFNALSMGVKGDKTIYYSDITSVQFKEPGLVSGYIQFSINGGNERTGGIFDALNDENSISIVSTADIAKAREIVSFVNEKLREVKTNKGGTTVVQQQLSGADELKKYKDLFDSGVISQEEFEAKKKQILGI